MGYPALQRNIQENHIVIYSINNHINIYYFKKIYYVIPRSESLAPGSHDAAPWRESATPWNDALAPRQEISFMMGIDLLRPEDERVLPGY
jgi:hypothetical protein